MFTYILKSHFNKEWIYVGSAASMERRLQEHKRGKTVATKQYKGSLYVSRCITCNTRKDAYRLERYLKKNLDLLHLYDADLLVRSQGIPYTDWESNLPV